MNKFLFLGALNGLLSVALGAFGAHVLRGNVDDYSMSIWQTAVQYEMLHAVAMVAVGILAVKFPSSSLLNWSGWLFFIGVILFSGSLFVLSLTGISPLGMITPFGGVSFVAGWFY